MAKPTKNATPICLLVTIIALIGIIISFAEKNALWIFLMMLPAVIYEAYRTKKGASTKISSISLLIILILEIVFIIFNINYDLAKFFEADQKYIAGYYLPLGDIKIVGPILITILATILFFRTYGIYTKWLAVTIGISALAATYIIDPLFFSSILKTIVNSL